jgi:hypothetical protein
MDPGGHDGWVDVALGWGDEEVLGKWVWILRFFGCGGRDEDG